MEARLFRVVLGAMLVALIPAEFVTAAGYRTQNFVVDAPTPELAREIGDWAEKYRKELAIDWLGQEMRPWAQPCLLTAQVAPNLGAGGATSFIFEGGEVHGWRMTIQGSQERLLDSVLPHEVTHTVFATHFRQALPRWADEGACTTVEHSSERLKQQQMLISFLKTGRGIAFSQMFAMKEYPQDVMPLYSQGYSLARYLIAHGGKRKYLQFLATGMQNENWPAAIRQYYGHENLMALQNTWLDWVRVGSPHIEPPKPAAQLAAAQPRRPLPSANLIYRAQSEDPPAAVASAKGAPRSATHNAPASEAVAAAPASHYQQMSRPQGVQKSQQIILEWDKRASAAGRAPAQR